MMDMGAFDKAQEAAIREVYAKGHEEKIKGVMAAGRSVIMNTPVGNPSLWKRPAPKGYVGGTARGNWQFSNINPEAQVIPRIDPNGSETLAEGFKVIDQSKEGEAVWLVNNVPYIGVLNDGNHSVQASGFVEAGHQAAQRVAGR